MQNSQPPSSRRRFFAGAATVGAAAAAVATLPHVLPASSRAVQDAEAARPVPENGGGYHLSAHVKQYYKTTHI